MAVSVCGQTLKVCPWGSLHYSSKKGWEKTKVANSPLPKAIDFYTFISQNVREQQLGKWSGSS